MGTLFSPGCPLSPLMSPLMSLPSLDPPTAPKSVGKAQEEHPELRGVCALFILDYLALFHPFCFNLCHTVAGQGMSLWPPPGPDSDGDITCGREKMEATKMRKIQDKSIGNTTPSTRTTQAPAPAPPFPLEFPKKGFPNHCCDFLVSFALGKGWKENSHSVPTGFYGLLLPEVSRDGEIPPEAIPGSQRAGNGHEGMELPRNPWEGPEKLCHKLGTALVTPSPPHAAPGN